MNPKLNLQSLIWKTPRTVLLSAMLESLCAKIVALCWRPCVRKPRTGDIRRLEVCLVWPLLLESIPRSKCHSLAICARGETLWSWVKLAVAWKSVEIYMKKCLKQFHDFRFERRVTIECQICWSFQPLKQRWSDCHPRHHLLFTMASKSQNWCGTVHLESRI